MQNIIPGLHAVVNSGRWIVECPRCKSAVAIKQFGALAEYPRFGCVDCGFGMDGALWEQVKKAPIHMRLKIHQNLILCMTVEYVMPAPSEVAAIELALLRRAHPAWQNWLPGMTAQELIDAEPGLHFSWTAPRTWVVSEVVTASIMNTHVRDDLLETSPAKVTTKGDLTPATAANALARLAVGNDDQVLIADAAQSTGMKWSDKADSNYNLLINGGFGVLQRLATALTTIPGASATVRIYTADRWGFTVGNVTTPKFQQVDTIAAPETGLGARYYGKYKQITNAAKQFVSQVLLASDVAPLRGRTVRFQARMKYSVAASMTVRLGLIQLNSAGVADTMPATFISAFNADGTDPTLGTNLAYITPVLADGGTIVGSAMDCVLTNGWVRYSATFVVPADCQNLVVGVWSNSAIAALDELNISECGLYIGKSICEWNPVPFEADRIACLFYYQKTFPYTSPPAEFSSQLNAPRGTVVIAGAVTTSSAIQWRFTVPLRISPLSSRVTFYNPSAFNAFMRNIPLGTDATATSAGNHSNVSIDINCTGLAGWVVGNEIKVHATVDGEL